MDCKEPAVMKNELAVEESLETGDSSGSVHQDKQIGSKV